LPAEIFWLMLTIVLTGLLWIPYILDRIGVRGLMRAIGNPMPDDLPHSRWADRLMRAHGNAVENLVVFAPLVLIAHMLAITSALTVFAAMLYFWARLAHAVVYTLGIPGLRTITFAAGFAAQAILALAIFHLL